MPEITSVNPAIDLAEPNYTQNASLTDNLPILKRRLHRKIFLREMDASKYSVNVNSNGIRINFQGTNENEQNTVNKVSKRAKELSEVIADEILSWLKASQQSLQVKVPHAFDNNAHIALSNTPFFIETGGSSTPKGLKIE
jgi:hypothetical protein